MFTSTGFLKRGFIALTYISPKDIFYLFRLEAAFNDELIISVDGAACT